MASSEAPRLLHASPARTVWLLPSPIGGDALVAKVFTAGARADAEREFAAAALARGPGVVDVVDVIDDPATARPCLRSRHVAGVDLDQLVAAEGALPAATACALLAPAANTLARLHALATPAAPRGLCHGDVKPKNLLRTDATTLLLDFEHAAAITPGAVGPRGTAGFAAPEAAAGAAPAAALDVFGLGATLAWLLDGGLPRAVPRAPRVQALIAACTAADPAARPTAAAVAAQLQELAAELPNDPAEATLADWATAQFLLPAPPTFADARTTAWRRRRRLLQRRPGLLTPPERTRAPAAGAAATGAPRALAADLAAAAAALARFPRHRGALAHRAELRAEVGERLQSAAAEVAHLRKQDEFEAAAAWLDGLDAAVRLALAAPGGLPPAATGDAPARAPLDALRALRAQLAAERAEVDDALAAIADAERRLDPRGAEAAVDALAARRGGATPLVAQQRDRLHRFGFYLDRIARARPSLARCEALHAGDPTPLPLRPVHALLAAVRATTDAGADAPAGAAVGLRGLLSTLGSLVDEFPHVAAATPARDALRDTLARTTDAAWQTLADTKQQLLAVPVPVRPLRLALGRLDTLRSVEALIDRPERPRSQLLDLIEALRLALDQARSARDRLAASAEHALARGHWTTGLFEMERAARIEPGDDAERADAHRLQERLQEARRRKQEVDAAVRRNVELAARFAALQDDPAATSSARQQALTERRDCLLFLTMNVPQDRSELYRRDLRDVDTQLALERAAATERRLDATADLGERLRLARATADELVEALAQGPAGSEPPGRLVRALEHWRTVAQQCQQAVDAAAQLQGLRQRQRRRVLVLLAAVAALAATALVLAVR